MSNRTHGSDFLPFPSVHDTGTERRSPLLHVWGSHSGKGVFLVVARYDFSFATFCHLAGVTTLSLHCLTKIFLYHVTIVFLFLDLVPLATRKQAC